MDQLVQALNLIAVIAIAILQVLQRSATRGLSTRIAKGHSRTRRRLEKYIKRCCDIRYFERLQKGLPIIEPAHKKASEPEQPPINPPQSSREQP